MVKDNTTQLQGYKVFPPYNKNRNLVNIKKNSLYMSFKSYGEQ